MLPSCEDLRRSNALGTTFCQNNSRPKEDRTSITPTESSLMQQNQGGSIRWISFACSHHQTLLLASLCPAGYAMAQSPVSEHFHTSLHLCSRRFAKPGAPPRMMHALKPGARRMRRLTAPPTLPAVLPAGGPSSHRSTLPTYYLLMVSSPVLAITEPCISQGHHGPCS